VNAFNHLLRKMGLRSRQLRSVNIRSAHSSKINSIRPRELLRSLTIGVHSRKINSIRPRELLSSLTISIAHTRLLNNIRENRHGPRPTLPLMRRLSMARQSSQEQHLRWVGHLSSRSNTHRGIAGPRVPRMPGVPRVRGVPAHARADGCDCESAAAVVV
jgi:hypothetical protein